MAIELINEVEIIEEDGSWYEEAVSAYQQADEHVSDAKWLRSRVAYKVMWRATETGDRTLLPQFAGDVRRSAAHLRDEAFAWHLRLALEGAGRPVPSTLSPGFYVEAAKSLGTRTAIERGDRRAIEKTADALDAAEDGHWTVATMRENHRALGTGENEWYTPPDVVEDVRRVLGTIELDPASSDAAQKVVRAEHYFTAEDNSLDRQWFGKVFLNPPYSKGLIGPFVSRLVEEVNASRVSEAIVLTHNYTDTRWFHTVLVAARLICFTKGRIEFVSQYGESSKTTQGQAFFYYGENGEKFREVFSKRGSIVRR